MNELEKFRREAWGLKRMLFRIRQLDEADLVQVFTARDRELERALIAIGDAPTNLLINGVFGVGKTVFTQMLLRGLHERYGQEVLCISECLDSVDADLPTTILRGLAQALCYEDPDAKAIDELLAGVELTTQVVDKNTGNAELNLGFFKGGGSGEASTTESRARKFIPNAPYQIRQLIERAKARFPQRRLVIAVDDLDKRDPNTVRENLSSARSTLHNHACSFIFTGHPLSILRDAYSSLGGVFDDRIELQALAPEQMQELMVKYLAAGRLPDAPEEKRDVFPFTAEAAQAIIQQAFGLPRVLNVICFHILSEAASLRYSHIDREALHHCWQLAGDRLKQGARADVRSLLEVISEQTQGLDPLQANDTTFDRLGEILAVDSYEALLNKFNAILQSPESLIVGVERAGRSLFLPQPLLQSLASTETEETQPPLDNSKQDQ
ncbi:MAG: AAA family ATPase [Blastocatellia bacterium]